MGQAATDAYASASRWVDEAGGAWDASLMETAIDRYGRTRTLFGAIGVLLVWWFFFGACLRAACWFSLVEASTGRCIGLA